MNREKSIVQLTWPIFLENIFRLSLGLVNVYMISQFSEQAVGAVGVANEIISIPVVLFSIVATGTTVSINQYLGSRQTEKAMGVAKVAIILNLLFGLLLSILLIIFSDQLLMLMKLSADRIPYGAIYLRIVGGAVFIQALSSTISGIFRSYGHTSLPMYFSLISNVINVIGNYIVVQHHPEWGVTGIAVTNVLATSSTLIMMLFLLKQRINIKFILTDFFHLEMKIVKNIFRIGLPSAGEFISYRGSQLMIAYIINIMVVLYDAVNTRIFVNNIMNFIWTIGMSIGQATMILVGHNVGAKKFESAYKLAIRSLIFAMMIDTSFAIIATVNSQFLLGIFTNNSDIIEIGTKLLFITILLEPGRAFNLVIVNALRASGDVRYPVFIGIISMWCISVPLAYLLGIYFNLGLIGIWIAFAVDEWFRGFILFLRWINRKWILKRLEI